MGKSRKALGAAFQIALSMEEPLNAAPDLTRAFNLVGLGLESIDDDAGKPTLALAEALTERLEIVKTTWEAVLDCAKTAR